MATQVLELTGLGGEGWSGAALIDPALIEGGGTAYLRFIRRIGNNFQVRLSATATADPENVGPEFTEAFETADGAFTFTAGASPLVLKGPGNDDNSFADADEPYFWTPDNSAAMSSWFASTLGNFTLTLTDGRPDVAVHAVRGAAAAGGAETRARIEVVPALALSDFDGRGLEFDVLALIRAGSGSGGTIYASPPRGAVGALLDGELGLGEDDVPITRIRRRQSGTVLQINDNGPLHLGNYFGAGGAGADLTLHIQARAGRASGAVGTQSGAAGNGYSFGPYAAAFETILAGISDGERFIVALARQGRAVVETRGTAEAGAPEAADRVLTALEISHPAVAQPVRVINDTQGRAIEGNDYVALRFEARLADDIAGQAPQAELSIDNVGRALTQWIEAAQGGVGATVRVVQVLDIEDPPVEWEITMDVAGMAVDQERVTARLGFDPLLGGAAVTLRHDPETSPGLF